MCVVLNKNRLLAVVPGLMEEKIVRRGGVEDGPASSVGLTNLSSGDVVGELFVDETVNGVGSSFDFVVTKLGSDGGVEIAFAKTAVLKRLNGPRSWIGSEFGFAVTHAALHSSQDVGGESVPIGDLA